MLKRLKGISYSLLAVLIFLPFTTHALYAEKKGVLRELLKPQMIKVYGDQLFVVEKHNFFIYSLKDLHLVKKVGKLGEGPGEFKPDRSRTILISAFQDYILGESRNKIIWFSRAGKYIKELRKSPGIIQTLAVGKNFAVLRILYGKNGKNFFAVSIYDAQMKEIKMIYKQPFFTYEDKVYIIPDGLFFTIIEDKIYVDQSPEGFLIGVYDEMGEKVKEIRKEFTPVPVNAAHREEAFNDFLEIPSVQRMIKEQGRAAAINFAKQQKLTYPEFFPAIRYMLADQGKLYIKTYVEKQNKEQYLLMDTNGKLLKTYYLPKTKKVEFLVRMQGDKKYYTIHDNVFYYLKNVEKDEDEIWELHSETLN